MHRSTTTAPPVSRAMLLYALLPVGLAAPAAGQGLTLAPFAAVNGGLDPAPRTVGLAATIWWGAVGFRAGGSMDVPSSPVAPLFGYPPAEATQAWAADADMVLSGGRAGVALPALHPSVFVGFGVHGRRYPDGTSATIPAWSYGAGVSVPVGSWLSVDAEGRYRMPHEPDETLLPAGVGGGWEVRAGVAVHLGGTAVAARPYRRPRTIRMGGSRRAGEDGPRAGGASRARTASADAVARSTLSTADRYVGVPYEWGGETPAEGFDCSGFVQYVFARNGVHLPRVSRDQRWAGRAVSPVVSALLPGDLMFYADRSGVVNHVAMYAGGNRIIHSSSSGRGVRYDDLSSRRGRYYATRMVAARRVIPDDGVVLIP